MVLPTRILIIIEKLILGYAGEIMQHIKHLSSLAGYVVSPKSTLEMKPRFAIQIRRSQVCASGISSSTTTETSVLH